MRPDETTPTTQTKTDKEKPQLLPKQPPTSKLVATLYPTRDISLSNQPHSSNVQRRDVNQNQREEINSGTQKPAPKIKK